jgi:hypothetical protein
MKRYVLLTFALSLIATQAMAADYWRAAFNLRARTISYVDRDSIKQLSPTIRRAWTTMVVGHETDGPRALVTKSLIEFDCQQQTTRIISDVDLSPEGDVLRTNNRPQELINIVPNSFGADEMQSVCHPEQADPSKRQSQNFDPVESAEIFLLLEEAARKR